MENKKGILDRVMTIERLKKEEPLCPRCRRGTLALCHVDGKAVMGCDECSHFENIDEELAILAGQ